MSAPTTEYLDVAHELTLSALRWSEATVEQSTRAWLEVLDSLAPTAAGSEAVSGLPKPGSLINAGLNISDDLIAAQRELAIAISVTVNGFSPPDTAGVTPAASTATPATAAGPTPVEAAEVTQRELDADELPFPNADTATIEETLTALEGSSEEQVARFIAWERENKTRKTLLDELEAPFPGAATATISDTLKALDGASEAELTRFIEWERRNRARKTLLAELEG